MVSQTHSNITTLNERQFLKHMCHFLPTLLQEGEMGLKKHLASALYHAETKTWPHTYMLYSEPRLKWLYLVCLVLALSGSDSLVRNLWGICWSWWSLGNALRLCCIVQGMFWVLDGITSGLPCFSWGHADHWIELGEPLPSWQVSRLHQLLLWKSLLATGVTSILVKKKRITGTILWQRGQMAGNSLCLCDWILLHFQNASELPISTGASSAMLVSQYLPCYLKHLFLLTLQHLPKGQGWVSDR